MNRQSTVVAFGAAPSNPPAAGAAGSPIEDLAGEVIFDARRSLDASFSEG